MPKQTEETHSPMAGVLPYPETAVSNVENSLMHNTRFARRKTAAQKAAQTQHADVASRKSASVKGDRVQKEVHRKPSPRSTAKIFGWDSPTFRAIWRQILDGSCSTAAIIELHTVRG